MFLTAKDVAATIFNGKLSARTVYRMAKNKTLPSVKIGGKVLFIAEDVERFIAELRCPPPTPAAKHTPFKHFPRG